MLFTVSFIPKIRNCSPSQFDTIYRISQPSPACRVSTDSNDSKCRSTNLKKFSKISRLLPQGREPRGAAPALPLSAMGEKIRDSAKPQRFYPHPNPRQNSHFLKGVDATALQGGREGFLEKIHASSISLKITQKIFKVRFSCMSKDLR